MMKRLLAFALLCALAVFVVGPAVAADYVAPHYATERFHWITHTSSGSGPLWHNWVTTAFYDSIQFSNTGPAAQAAHSDTSDWLLLKNWAHSFYQSDVALAKDTSNCFMLIFSAASSTTVEDSLSLVIQGSQDGYVPCGTALCASTVVVGPTLGGALGSGLIAVRFCYDYITQLSYPFIRLIVSNKGQDRDEAYFYCDIRYLSTSAY